MIPFIAAGIAGLASFVGITMFQKKQAAAASAASGAAAAPFAGTATTPSGAGNIVPANLPPVTADTSIAAASALLGIPPSGVALRPGTRAPTVQDLIESLKDPANFPRLHPEIDFDSTTVEQSQAAFDAFTAQNPGAGAGTGAIPGVLAGSPGSKQAIVTTNDPPPSGDLIIRDAPNGTQIGGADKNGTVIILDDSDPVWSKIQWNGGRLPAATGFAHKSALRLI